MGKLDGKVAAITGSGVGIGREIALSFAKEGAFVVVNDILPERMNETIDLIKEINGNVIGVAGDVRKQEVVDELIEAAVKDGRKLDILVNNAGIMDNMDPVGDVTDEVWFNVMDTNVNAYMRCARKAVGYMLNQKKGNIINLSSLVGLTGGRAGVAYTASKWAVIGFSKNITAMYSKQGIRCNTICPGGVSTHFGENSVYNEFGKERVFAGTSTSYVRRGTPDEIANLALFLASDESDLINGAVITADSGWSAY